MNSHHLQLQLIYIFVCSFFLIISKRNEPVMQPAISCACRCWHTAGAALYRARYVDWQVHAWAPLDAFGVMYRWTVSTSHSLIGLLNRMKWCHEWAIPNTTTNDDGDGDRVVQGSDIMNSADDDAVRLPVRRAKTNTRSLAHLFTCAVPGLLSHIHLQWHDAAGGGNTDDDADDSSYACQATICHSKWLQLSASVVVVTATNVTYVAATRHSRHRDAVAG